jgi:hypothetical protein
LEGKKYHANSEQAIIFTAWRWFAMVAKNK